MLAAFFFVSGKIFPGLDVGGCHQADDAFALDQPLQQLSDGAAGRIDRRDITTQPMGDTNAERRSRPAMERTLAIPDRHHPS